jgi:glycosyl hydrolase family 99
VKLKFVGVCILACLVLIAPASLVMGSANQPNPIPIMAYYYIWYNTQSWNRAKTDYPLLGRYSSDDRAIIEQHVQMAHDAGIDGFIVSWKSTYALDHNLELLMDVAAAKNFHLWIIYEGLDFNRKPLPIDRIINDLEYFRDNYASHPAFSMYDHPIVIWSGTWEFSPQDIATVTQTFRNQLYILASERNVKGYLRIADKVDGNAYYWSSVNPDTFPGYQEKLDAMSEAVHKHQGLWIAPASPGFDARLIGGTQTVDRKEGETLRMELGTALRSTPDAIGLISWNEFSENTYIEPSQKYHTQALDVLADRQTSLPASLIDFDSSDPGDTDPGQPYPFVVIAVFLAGIVGTTIIAFHRRGYRLSKSSSGSD